MKRSLHDLTKFNVEATDGLKGHVKDFLFDEEQWIIRYLEADLGEIFSGKKVLIPKRFFEDPDWLSNSFSVNLNKEQIENCPGLDQNAPISRKYEQKLNEHYQVKNYWSNYTAYVPGTGTGMVYFPPRPIAIPPKDINEKDLGTSLRSFHEIKGYHIKSTDKELGHAADIIIDDLDWQIIYLVVDTNNWLPWSKKVLISTEWLEKISFVDRIIEVGLNSEVIEEAPEYDPGEFLSQDFEEKLHSYFHEFQE